MTIHTRSEIIESLINKENRLEKKYSVNRSIRSRNVLLLGNNNEGNKEIPFAEAIILAENEGLDLVQVNEHQGVATCKIMDFGAFKYKEEKKRKEQECKNRPKEVKSLSFRPVIGDGDYNIKIKKAKEFLANGHRVRFAIKLKGREFVMIDNNKNFALKIISDLSSQGELDGPLTALPKDINFTIKPLKAGDTVK